MDAIVECFGRVDTKKLRCRGCDRILRSSRYEEMDWFEDAREYSGRVDTKEWSCRGSNRILWSSRYNEIVVSRMQ